MGTGMGTEQEHKGILERDTHKSGPWLELLPHQPLEGTSWSAMGSRETRWPLGTVPMTGTASVGGGGVSASHRGAGASWGRARGVYPCLSPFLLAQPWLQHKLSFVPLPRERCQPSPVPRDTREMPSSPFFSQPHALAETVLFLGTN